MRIELDDGTTTDRMDAIDRLKVALNHTKSIASVGSADLDGCLLEAEQNLRRVLAALKAGK